MRPEGGLGKAMLARALARRTTVKPRTTNSHHAAGHSRSRASLSAEAVPPDGCDHGVPATAAVPLVAALTMVISLSFRIPLMSAKHFYHVEVLHLIYFRRSHDIFYLPPPLSRPHRHAYN